VLTLMFAFSGDAEPCFTKKGRVFDMSWLRIRELVRKEFIQLFRDRKNRPLLIISPLVQLIVFGYVVTTDVRDIRVGFADQSRTSESRRLIDAIDGNKTFRITHYLRRSENHRRSLAAAQNRPGFHHSAGL
jgi:ABC-2 type transport system permease protein